MHLHEIIAVLGGAEFKQTTPPALLQLAPSRIVKDERRIHARIERGRLACNSNLLAIGRSKFEIVDRIGFGMPIHDRSERNLHRGLH